MTYREIRDQKFKILFTYYFQKSDIENIFLNFFNNYPYEEDGETNEYVSGDTKSHKNVNSIVIEEKDVEKNESDKALEISIGEEDIIRDIKQKVKDIIEKTDEIDDMIKENLKDWDVSRVGKPEITIIRLALYEMYYDPSIDIEVAINEAVELAKVYADDKADKFINGVLATIYKAKKK